MPTVRRTERFVALLRGINVGRAKRVAMADLRDAVAGLGFTEVRTLLNSGNVVFDGARASPVEIADAIERAVAERTGVQSVVTVLGGRTFAAVLEADPLVAVADDPSRHLVGFLRAPADARVALAPLATRRWTPEAFALGADAAYLWCANGITGSPLAEAVGRLLGDGVTTRNRATAEKLRALL